MLNSEIAQLLRTAAARLDGTDAYLAPTTPTTPRATPAADSAPKISGGACPPGMLRGMCTFWKMDTTASGRARGRVGVSWRDNTGEHKEYYNCFDEKVLHKIDPVPVGMLHAELVFVHANRAIQEILAKIPAGTFLVIRVEQIVPGLF
jgi:hypothetical protein